MPAADNVFKRLRLHDWTQGLMSQTNWFSDAPFRWWEID